MSRNFDGTNDKVVLANEGNFDFERTSPFSILFWLKPDNTNTATQSPFAKLDGGPNFAGFDILTNHSGSVADPGKFRFALINVNVTNDIDVGTTNDTNLNDGNWHFYAFIYTGSSTAAGITFYEDGVSVGLSTIRDGLSASMLNNQSLTLGSRPDDSLDYDGHMAHFSVFNRTLSLNEINQIRRFPGSITNGLLAYLPLWGTSSPEPDYSGNGNSGTVTGAIAGTTEPPINGIFQVPRPQLITVF